MMGMKAALTIYWIFGCALWGAVEASAVNRCPRDEFPITVNDVAGVVLWPAFIVGAFFVEKDKLEYPKCRTESP